MEASIERDSFRCDVTCSAQRQHLGEATALTVDVDVMRQGAAGNALFESFWS